ncbi:hypothetical protein QR680_006382 [Steinernema hermaphroditum]|uniref:RING-type domain-containing protein n=1 Tax=Steinernema hermaphroditum TaxID=289476 RepID=A0AA39HXR3_9BILA|nr:hypothetical protein QR680_006382 [Steinernema hermaphroditum]
MCPRRASKSPPAISSFQRPNCAICLDWLGSDADREVVVTDCGHVFHKDCIHHCIKLNPRNALCPSCRGYPGKRRKIFLSTASFGQSSSQEELKRSFRSIEKLQKDLDEQRKRAEALERDYHNLLRSTRRQDPTPHVPGHQELSETEENNVEDQAQILRTSLRPLMGPSPASSLPQMVMVGAHPPPYYMAALGPAYHPIATYAPHPHLPIPQSAFTSFYPPFAVNPHFQ